MLVVIDTDIEEHVMFTSLGATGRVGSAAAHHLLEAGAPVRVVVRNEAKGAAWAGRGAQVAVADLSDRPALAAALDRSAGVFVLLPFDPTVADIDATTRSQVEAIAGAVADSGVPHVAQLLGAALGRELQVVTVPQPGWVDALVGTGLPLRAAELLAELADADQRGVLSPRGDRTVTRTTPLETTLETLLGVPA